MRRVGLRALALIAVLALGLAACTSDSGGGSSSPDDTSGGSDGGSVIQPGWVNGTDLEPTTGGTLQVSLGAPPSGLDPNSGTLGLVTQGPIYTAIFDSLLRYDPESGEITGQLAEGISHNEDMTEWTITLRPDVMFTDGTPLDAQAVAFNIEARKSAANAARTYPDYFSAVETPDAQTVVLRLDEPLASVDSLFATELGFIGSPTAMQNDPDGFATNPVGAGPFKVESFDQDAELNLVKNPDYALGDVPLDGIRMTWNVDPQANLDKVTTGQADIAVTANIPTVVSSIEQGLPTYTTLAGGAGFAINNAADRDFPGDDPRLRQAISMAIDIESFNQRVNDGQGVLGPWLLPPSNRFYVDTPYSLTDQDEARRLVEEVKADTGWDGSLVFTTPPPDDQALAWQAQLNAIGLDVQLDLLQSYTQLIEKTYINRDFDLSLWSMLTYDTNLYQALSRSLESDSTGNYSSINIPELDSLMGELRVASGEEEITEVLNQVAELFQTEQPFFYTGTQPYTTITNDKVGGLVQTANGVFLWGEAFKAS